MAKVRKPIPKTQKQLSNEQVTPTYPQYGDPNDFIQTPQNNRALNTSFKGDTTKPFSVGIQDIDEAIYYYFQNVVQPSVTQNGARLNVPVIYGSPEKWKSFQKDGYYRDQKGKIMAPLIMFKKTDITKNRQIANKLDANYPNNFGVFTKEYTQRNAYDNFKVLANRKPQKQYYAVVMPDYLTVTYECAVFTYYVEQLNKIVESMEYASDSYWGDPQRYQFKASIDSFGFQTELAQDDERIVRSTFTLKINGYIIPEILQKDVTALKKFSNITKTTFTLEDEPTTPITEAPLPPIPFTCAPATVLNSGSTYIDSVNSGGTLILPNQTININSTGSGLIPSVGDIGFEITDGTNPVIPNNVSVVGRTVTVEVPSGGGSPSGVLFDFPTGKQVVSYRTGDEGWLAANGYFDIVQPTNPKVVAKLDYSVSNYFYQLASPLVVNGVSSVHRFVDVSGVQVFAGSETQVLIDKLTGLMITRERLASSLTWDTSIDTALTYSTTINSVTYDNWHLITLEEATKVFGSEMGGIFSDPITSAVILNIVSSSAHTSTTTSNDTTRNYSIAFGAANILYSTQLKTFATRRTYCRDARNLITAP